MLIPDLQQSLIDPLPEVRATAAKAIGSLLQGMGEHHSQDLMPWLLQTLKSEVHIPELLLPSSRLNDLSSVQTADRVHGR